MSNKTLIVCSVLVVSLKTTVEKTRYDVRNVSDGCTHFVRYGGRFCLGALSGINIVLFSVCILCICILFVFCNYSFTFFVNYSPPQIRRTHFPTLGKRIRLIWGDEAFTEVNFIHLFLFIMYDVYVANVSSLIKLSYYCVLKRFTAFS